MAQKATIHKVELSVSDMDRHYYETHNLTVAKHPSETDERLMLRILAFALNAHEQLEFTRGISTENEPDIWQKSLSGEHELWVALGLPGEKVVRQSCGKANDVIVYCYGGSTAETVTSSSSTVTQTDTNKPFMLVSELITAGEASIALYGADYSANSNETILKLTLNGDITRFDADNSSLYTSVAGAELDILLDWTKFEAIEYNEDTSKTYEMSKDYAGKLFLGAITNDNGEFSKIVFSSLNTSTKPVLTLIDSVSTTGRGETDRPTEINLATIYLNPLDSADEVLSLIHISEPTRPY